MSTSLKNMHSKRLIIIYYYHNATVVNTIFFMRLLLMSAHSTTVVGCGRTSIVKYFWKSKLMVINTWKEMMFSSNSTHSSALNILEIELINAIK